MLNDIFNESGVYIVMNATDEKEAVLRRVKEARVYAFGDRGGQAEAASKMGLQPNYYATYETRSIMKPDVLREFCEITGARAEYILTGQEPKWKKDDLNSIVSEKVKAALANMSASDQDIMVDLYEDMQKKFVKKEGNR